MTYNRFISGKGVVTASVTLIIFLLSHSMVVAQVDSVLNFFPLHSGDVHQYLYHGYGASGYPCSTRTWKSYHLEKIRGDTLLPTGYQYKIITSSVPNDPPVRYLRVDTTSANIYMYTNYPSPSDVLEDSLRATIGSSFIREGLTTTECIGIDTATILGVHTVVKRFRMNYIFGEVYSLALGFGRIQHITYEEDACNPTLDSFYRDLVYAKIASKEFGSLVNVDDYNQILPSFFTLNQNYPNPFNPITTITYELPVKSHVTLKVFDLLGQEVTTLVNGFEEPGIKLVRFDASISGGLPSGIYYYRLQAGNYIETRKLVLLR